MEKKVEAQEVTQAIVNEVSKLRGTEEAKKIHPSVQHLDEKNLTIEARILGLSDYVSKFENSQYVGFLSEDEKKILRYLSEQEALIKVEDEAKFLLATSICKCIEERRDAMREMGQLAEKLQGISKRVEHSDKRKKDFINLFNK